MRALRVWGAAIAAVLLAGSEGLVARPARADEAPWPTRAWAVSTPEAQGMDSGRLARMVDTIGAYKQDSLLIARYGKVVLDVYYAPYAADIPHDQRSVTKSVVGTLTAIAIQQGKVAGVDHKILDLFDDIEPANLDDNKRTMTVQNLLDMASGIAWVERNYTPDETIIKMYASPNRTRFVLDQPMSDAPGSRFYYNGGNPYVLSALITRKSGRSAFDFAKDELFGPLGIAKASWRTVDAQGVSNGESGLYLTPRDMAKLGYLYLRNGAWDGRQLIPPAWVARARDGAIAATFGRHYANLWWSLPEKGAYMALGRHSQIILVLPRLDIVAVMTGTMRDDEFYATARLIDDIAGAVKSDGPLPPDPVAHALLATSLDAAGREKPSPIGLTPALAREISGKSYRFGPNRLKVRTYSVNLTGPQPSWEITTESDQPGAPPERYGGLIGLHGLFSKTPASYGINAVKGRWLNIHSFAIERRILGRGETQYWVLTFDGKSVDVRFESTDGLKTDLHGEAID
jgi:CubicO group peptidase (beta-lactamase class C family)